MMYPLLLSSSNLLSAWQNPKKARWRTLFKKKKKKKKKQKKTKNKQNKKKKKKQVTIFGQSAGGRSIAIHLISPLSKDLFHKAIILSDPMHIVLSSKQEALALGERFSQAVGCDPSDFNCLHLLGFSFFSFTFTLNCGFTFAFAFTLSLFLDSTFNFVLAHLSYLLFFLVPFPPSLTLFKRQWKSFLS